MFDDEDDDLSFFQRNRPLVIVAVVIIFGAGAFFAWKALGGSHQSVSRQDDTIMVRLPPMPPPPPPKPLNTPPPLETPPPEQAQPKMVDQAPVQNEKKEEAPKPIAAPAPLGTGITGPGPGMAGLIGGPGGLGGGNGTGGSGGGGSKYGWYASEVQTRIADALRNNPKTRGASMKIVVRIWPDSTGRVSKARIQGSTGDPSTDSALNDILTGMQLTDPPPSDMPLPIVMRISAARP
jgi:protein TonB